MATSFDFFRVEQRRYLSCARDALIGRPYSIEDRDCAAIATLLWNNRNCLVLCLCHMVRSCGDFHPRNTKAGNVIKNRCRTLQQTKKAVVDNRGLRNPRHVRGSYGRKLVKRAHAPEEPRVDFVRRKAGACNAILGDHVMHVHGIDPGEPRGM